MHTTKPSRRSWLTYLSWLALAGVALGTAGCPDDRDGPAERAGEAVDEAVDEAGEAVEEAGDAIEDATD